MLIFFNPTRPWRSVKGLKAIDEASAQLLWGHASRKRLVGTILRAIVALVIWWFLMIVLVMSVEFYLELQGGYSLLLLAAYPYLALLGWTISVAHDYYVRTAKSATQMIKKYWDDGKQIRCARCDYSLKGTPQASRSCPECGMGINRRPSA
ncbi:MAG: hypothetical protein AAF078_06740 [Planctomycetota bacterium]